MYQDQINQQPLTYSTLTGTQLSDLLKMSHHPFVSKVIGEQFCPFTNTHIIIINLIDAGV